MTDFRELLTTAQMAEAEELLTACGLGLTQELRDAACGLGLYEDGRLLGTGFWGRGRLMGLCLHPELRGQGHMLGLVDHLLKEALHRGEEHLFIFTKAGEAELFAAAGFELLAVTEAAAGAEASALLEWGQPRLAQWLAQTKQHTHRLWGEGKGPVTAVIVNANPLTLGHVHLLERASKLWQPLLVLVVEEDCSAFPFAVRLELVREGTKHIPHCAVLPAGPYVISQHTFPSYFTGEAGQARAHARLDATLFATRLAPGLGVTARFVGSEPLSPVTALYNEALHAVLPRHGVRVLELPRLVKDEPGGEAPISATGKPEPTRLAAASAPISATEKPEPTRLAAGSAPISAPISASRVRALLQAGELAAACALVPPCTQEFLLSEKGRALVQSWNAPETTI